MNVPALTRTQPTFPPVFAHAGGNGSFADALSAAVDGAASAIARANAGAGAVAGGSGSIVEASIARAKADVALEIVSIATSRISGAINSLLQTQV